MFIYILLFLSSLSCLISQDYYPFVRDDKLGYIDIEGNIKIEPILDTKVEYYLSRKNLREFNLGVKFPDYCYFNNGYAGCQKEKWLWFLFPYKRLNGIIDTNSNFLFFQDVKNLYPIKNGFFRFDYVDTKMPNDYDFNTNLINMNKLKNGFRFREYEIADEVEHIPHLNYSKYIYIGDFNDGRILIYEYSSNDYTNIFYTDSTGKIAIQLKNAIYAGDFSDSIALIKTSNDIYFIDINGNKILNNIGDFSDATSFSEKRAFIKRNEKFELIDNKGNILTNQKFDFAYKFKNGYAKVKIDDDYTIINTNGEIVLNESFVKFGDVYDGVFPVEVGNNIWKVYNLKTKKFEFEEYEYISNFKDGLALAWKEKQIHYINVKGDIVFTAIDERTYEKKHSHLIDRYN